MMRKVPILLAGLLLVIIGATVPFTQDADASGAQAATFDRVEMEVDPFIQGYGGEMVVTVTAYFYGGCCYSLFANDITPDLDVPEGLSIKEGPTPETRNSLTAVAGGEPTVTKFRWTLSCDEEGSYDLASTVDTSDCGSRGSGYTVHVIKGATITRPEMYPEVPTSDKDISLKFVSSYPVGDTKIESASIIYWTTEKDYDLKEMSVVGDSLVHQNENIEPSGTGEVGSKELELVEGGFQADIPKVSDPYLFYIIEVTDEKGEVTRSSIYRLEVEDVGEVEKWNMISALFLIVSMLVLIGLLYVGQNILTKRMEGVESEDRFSVLGPVGRKRYLTDEENEKIRYTPEMNWKYITVGVIIIIALGVSIFFIITGDATVLFDHFLEGK
jgi:hypothetical protein